VGRVRFRFTTRCSPPVRRKLTCLRQAGRRIGEYLREFAAQPERVGYLCYLYWGGYYAVSYDGVEEVTPEDVVRHLRIY